MTTPTAKIIADSIYGIRRLTTMEVVMHRFVLAEFNTHRAFSRNSASSRAIPVEKQLKRVMEDPAIPLYWGKNQKGMQAEAELSPEEQEQAKASWLAARDSAVESVQNLLKIGAHKQVTNRILEPFMWHTVIVTSTEWGNFFRQRCSPLAQPEIQAVAYAMRNALGSSQPVVNSSWHLPLINDDELKSLRIEELKAISVARCARVSYLTHEGKRDINADLDLFKKLKSATPPHMSPFEHVARPQGPKGQRGNFRGWRQFRHEVFPNG